MPYIGAGTQRFNTADGLTVSGNASVSGTTTLTGNATAAGTLDVTGAITSSAGATITTADNSANLTLTSTDADANSAPVLHLDRNSASPADDDRIAEIVLRGRNDAGQTVDYIMFDSFIRDASDGSEDSEIDFRTMVAGSEATRMIMKPAETVFNEASIDLDFRVESNGNANMLVVDGGNDRIGIGTNSPDQTLHVHKGSAGSVSSASTAVITLEDDGDTVLQFLSPNTASQQIRFGDPQDNGIGIITYNHNDNSMRFATNGPEKFRMENSGEMLIGTADGGSSNRLSVKGPGTLSVYTNTDANGGTYHTTILFRNSSDSNVGSITTNSTSVSYNTSSDHRLKENVADMSGAIDRVKQLAPKRFNFIANSDDTVDGFLAHEAQTVVPEAVSGTHNEVDDDGNAVMQGIDQSKLVPLLVGALKESIAKIEALEALVTALEDA